MDNRNGLPGNVIFANVASWIFAGIILALVWFGCVVVFGAFFGGLFGWIAGLGVAFAGRFLILLCLEVAEAFPNASWGGLAKVLDRVPERQWKWWLLGTMLGPTALIVAVFAISDFLARR
jgi:ABC-type antimicrobial peptide transport system permease subunit